MSAHRRETEYLTHAILYDNGDEGRKLVRSLAQVQRDQSCVERVAWLVALFLLAALFGIGYESIFQDNFPYAGSVFFFRVLCYLVLASLICLVGFAGLWTIYRVKLTRLRKECLQLVVRLLEAHLGKAQVSMTPGNDRVIHDGETLQRAAHYI